VILDNTNNFTGMHAPYLTEAETCAEITAIYEWCQRKLRNAQFKLVIHIDKLGGEKLCVMLADWLGTKLHVMHAERLKLIETCLPDVPETLLLPSEVPVGRTGQPVDFAKWHVRFQGSAQDSKIWLHTGGRFKHKDLGNNFNGTVLPENLTLVGIMFNALYRVEGIRQQPNWYHVNYTARDQLLCQQVVGQHSRMVTANMIRRPLQQQQEQQQPAQFTPSLLPGMIFGVAYTCHSSQQELQQFASHVGPISKLDGIEYQQPSHPQYSTSVKQLEMLQQRSFARATSSASSTSNASYSDRKRKHAAVSSTSISSNSSGNSMINKRSRPNSSTGLACNVVCTACTFKNAEGAQQCSMCRTPLAPLQRTCQSNTSSHASSSSTAAVDNLSVIRIEQSRKFRDSFLLRLDKQPKLQSAPFKRVIAFDVDDTLVTTVSGNRYAKDADDWQLIPEYKVSKVIAQLAAAGYGIVLITNQGGIGAAKKDKKEAKIARVLGKLKGIMRALPVPTWCFASSYYSFGRSTVLDPDCTRKPGVGNWLWLQSLNQDQGIDLKKSCFVGDAAGRPASQTHKKKDHSNSDQLFAQNVGLRFFTPQQFFLDKQYKQFLLDPASSTCSGVEELPVQQPAILGRSSDDLTLETDDLKKHRSSSVEMVIFVGCPGAGKSTYFESVYKPAGYAHINRDSLGSHDACLQQCRESFARQSSVVIDNTNPSPKARERYLSLARRLGIVPRVVWFPVGRTLAWKMNTHRSLTTSRQLIPEGAYSAYFRQFAVPSTAEGLQRITLRDPSLDMRNVTFDVEN
jgi:bifunctional polynucleotide phosphatase/kinase